MLRRLILVVVARYRLVDNARLTNVMIKRRINAGLLIVQARIRRLRFYRLASNVERSALNARTDSSRASSTTVTIGHGTELLAPRVRFLIRIPINAIRNDVAVRTPILTLREFPSDLRHLMILSMFLNL